MTDTLIFLSNALYSSFVLAIFASLVWGILSIVLSPCHLSSIPLIIGLLNSQKSSGAKYTFKLTLVFSLGIAISIAIIGLVTALAGRIIGDIGFAGNIIFSLIFILVGLFLMDLIPLDWNSFKLSKFNLSGMKQVFMIGVIFGIGLGPCTFAFMAPILGVVFSVSASDIPRAVFMLLAFMVGHCGVIIIAGNAAMKVQKYLNWVDESKVTKYLKRVCGFLVVLGGIYIFYKSVFI